VALAPGAATSSQRAEQAGDTQAHAATVAAGLASGLHHVVWTRSAMCQLFALSSHAPAAITFSFTGFSARGGQTGPHRDGYGVAFHDGPVCRTFIDDGAASDAPQARFLREHPIRARLVLAHVRRATQGAVGLANSHPFVREWLGRHWSFCHNGDLQGFHPRLDGHDQPIGSTDSERAFCWMLQTLRRQFHGQGAPGWRQLAPLLAELAGQVARHGRFNFLLSDGEVLYAHCSTRLHWLRRVHPFRRATLVDHALSMDLSAVNTPSDRMALLATEPLTRDEHWQPFKAGELRVFVDGTSVWQGATWADPAWARQPDPSAAH
jgi:predicted glutamine amidotransferase